MEVLFLVDKQRADGQNISKLSNIEILLLFFILTFSENVPI